MAEQQQHQSSSEHCCNLNITELAGQQFQTTVVAMTTDECSHSTSVSNRPTLVVAISGSDSITTSSVEMNGDELLKEDDEQTKTKVTSCNREALTVQQYDPWSSPLITEDNGPKWAELESRAKLCVVVLNIIKITTLISLLYVFVCSLDLLASSFRLIAARQAGAALSDSRLLQNPVGGLMIGVLATVLVQSSSTSTSIVVTMVASSILQVEQAIPITMGANIGTSVTNTIVSLAQSADRDQFRRAFAGATVHDMFNWMSVIILLPLEVATGYIYHVTRTIVSGLSRRSDNNDDKSSKTNNEFLQVITKPLTSRIIQLDKKVIEGLTTGDQRYVGSSLIKEWCGYQSRIVYVNETSCMNSSRDSCHIDDVDITERQEVNMTVPVTPCVFLFHGRGLTDTTVGIVLLAVSLFIICSSLVAMVKLLNSMLRGSVMSAAHRLVNAELPGLAAPLTGYAAMLAGAALTVVVQSSSVFTSMLTPLVGIGVVSLERVYPLTLGSNLGTTTTGLLAAFAAPADRFSAAVQIALCHLLFNLTGIVLFYPIPAFRIPIRLARYMGDTTARYRWFAVVYLLGAFFIGPLAVFGLSSAGRWPLPIALSVFGIVIVFIAAVTALQQRRPYWLPNMLRTWDRVPLWMRSLEPTDHVVSAAIDVMRRACSCCLERCCTDDDRAFDDGILKAGASVSTSDLGGPSTFGSRGISGVNSRHHGRHARGGSRLGPSGASAASLIAKFPRWGSVSSARPLLLLYGECESGYSSVSTTPAPSRLPSYAVIEMMDLDSQQQQQQHQALTIAEGLEEETQGAPRIVEMYIAEEDTDDDEDEGGKN